MNVAAPAGSPLIFNWGPPRPRKRAIATFLVLSVLAHAFCFYVFQIVYPPSVSLLPPSAQINMVSPATEDGRALLRWIEAEDPALTLTTMRPPESKTYALPMVEHVPSYAGWVPVLRDIPAMAVDRSIPSAAPPGPVAMQRSTAPVAPIGLHRTTVGLSEEFRERGEFRTPEPAFETSLLGAPENVRFRIAVNAVGHVRYCLPLNTSGDSALDQQARNLLVQSRFDGAANAAAADIWGIATVDWGNDVKRSASIPAP